MDIISADAIVISGVVALVGWGLKTSIQALIKVLFTTIAKVEVLSAKIDTYLDDAKSIPKMKQDLNVLHQRVGAAEEKLNKG